MSDDNDPKGRLVEFRRRKREPAMIAVRSPWDACKHEKLYVHEATRSVECRACQTKMDAFAVLLEMAHEQRRLLEEMDEWDARRESMLAERYDERWAKDHEGYTSPPSDPPLRKVWDVFHAAIGEQFCRMYERKLRKRTGPMWYGVSTYGLTISYEYAREKLTPKAVKTEEQA